jgi:hypothetical protein
MCSLRLANHFNGELLVTDKENEKVILPLKIMNKNEKVSNLLKLLDLVQKDANKEGCQHCLDLLESVFE